MHTPHTPSCPRRRGPQQRGLGCLRPIVLRRWVPRGVDAALVVVGIPVAVGGGGEEARGIPGGGEEDDDWGWEVQGGVDEARRATVMAGVGTTAWSICPSCFGGGGGSLLPPVVDRCGPVDDNGSDRGDKWQSNRNKSVIF